MLEYLRKEVIVMLTYNEKIVFDYNHYADVQLILYDDGICQGEIYIYSSHVLDYHVIVVAEGERVSSYTETPCHVLNDAPCDIQRMISNVADAMRAIINKEVDFNGCNGVF